MQAPLRSYCPPLQMMQTNSRPVRCFVFVFALIPGMCTAEPTRRTAQAAVVAPASPTRDMAVRAGRRFRASGRVLEASRSSRIEIRIMSAAGSAAEKCRSIVHAFRKRPSRASSPRGPALGYCQGSPLRAEIEARDPARLALATDTAAEAIAQRFGRGAVEAQIRAHIVTVRR